MMGDGCTIVVGKAKLCSHSFYACIPWVDNRQKAEMAAWRDPCRVLCYVGV